MHQIWLVVVCNKLQEWGFFDSVRNVYTIKRAELITNIDNANWFLPLRNFHDSPEYLDINEISGSTLMGWGYDHTLQVYVNDHHLKSISNALNRILDLNGKAGFFYTLTYNVLAYWEIIGVVLYTALIVTKAALRRYFGF